MGNFRGYKFSQKDLVKRFSRNSSLLQACMHAAYPRKLPAIIMVLHIPLSSQSECTICDKHEITSINFISLQARRLSETNVGADIHVAIIQ